MKRRQYTIPNSRNKLQKKTKKSYLIKTILTFAILLIMGLRFINSDLSISQDIIVNKGDTLHTIMKKNLTSYEELSLKFYLKFHPNSENIYPWIHTFSGTSFSKKEFLENLTTKPKVNYIKFTVLEGRSIYDIDDALTKKWLISAGEYSTITNNENKIDTLAEEFPFLSEKTINLSSELKSMEGFLMPDTYHIRPEQAIDDLIKLQLKNFNKKIRTPYQKELIQSKYWVYGTITLASIVEKEEKNPTNKSTVAGIFMNRLADGSLLGADISLCYAFKKPYTSCTSQLINEKVYEKSNPYNTRMNRGLPPTPIGNPSYETILSTLHYKKTNYYYYLHNVKTWKIYYGKTLQEHNANKKYM